MRAGLILSAAWLVVHPCTARAEPAPEAQSVYGPATAARSLLVRGTTDIAAFSGVLARFVSAYPDVRITYEQWASNDLYLQGAATCAGHGEAADLLISSSADQIVKLANDGCAQPHQSVETNRLLPALNWRDEVFGITREPAVIVYNKTLVPSADVPATRFDLIDLLRPAQNPYEGRIATYDIDASGLGYLFAFVDSEQATTFGSLMEAFGQSGAIATCCSAELIDGVANGLYLMAYNVLGSYALERAARDDRLGVVLPRDYTLMLSRAAMIPARASNPPLAGALLDFLLSEPGRAALSEAFLIYPDTQSDTFVARPIPLSPVLLVGLDRAKREQFLDLWHLSFPQRDRAPRP